MIKTACHCGAIVIEVPRKPRKLTACNCSVCRRTGAHWAHYQAPRVRIRRARGALASYAWGNKGLRFMRCGTCGCLTHWEATRNPRQRRMGVNMRNVVDPKLLDGVRIRLLDGARTWKFLD